MKKRCVVIDDNEANRIVASEIAESLGFNVHGTAESGYKALDKVFDNDISVILLDWHMPEMDGLRFLGELNATPDRKDMKVIIYSAVEEGSGNSKALSKGADGFISKPITFEKMQAEFKKLGII